MPLCAFVCIGIIYFLSLSQPQGVAAQVCFVEDPYLPLRDFCSLPVLEDNIDTTTTMSEEKDEGPVKVFILLGQSNMLGFGAVGGDPDKPGTLRYLVEKERKYSHLTDPDGKWVELPNVRHVHAMHKNGKMDIQANEWLTIKDRRRFGPELGFGHVIGPYFQAKKQQVLLLKACIGNRSLGWDLLPPGSSQFEYEGNIYAGYKESPNFWKKGTTPEPINWYAGKQYDDDTGMAKNILNDLEKYFPGAKAYEISGFVWWQGHKDNNAALAERYEENLARLIHSLRKDFDAPNAKFACATVAFDGPSMKGHFLKIADAQLAVSGEKGKYPEFKDNVRTIDARPFWRDKDQSPANQHHHYNQNAETFYEVGKALGEAMVELLDEPKNL